MTQKELWENYPPLKVGSQQEFDTWMSNVREQQAQDNVETNKEKGEIKRQRDMIRLQIQSLRQQDQILKMRFVELEDKQCDVNRMYHSLKHEMIVLNPKNSAQAQ